MADNKDIAVLAKKVYELSVLSVTDLEARKWEALLIVNAVYSSATPAGVQKANADKETRWGAQIKQEGILSMLHPKWHLRTDDGKPPAAKYALESALDNPLRDLRSRLAALLLIPQTDREPLADLVRALSADAWDGATGDARVQFSQAMGRISKTWTKEPWLTILPHDGTSPILILIDNQGVTNDGGLFDKDPSDDPFWATAIRTWDIEFLRDNPLAQFYWGVESAVSSAADTAAQVAEGANEAARGVATIIKWAPYVLAGIGVVGLTTIVVTTRR